MRSAAAKSRAFLAAARCGDQLPGCAASSSAAAALQVGCAAPAAARPARRPAPCSSAAVGGERVRFSSPASSNSTATRQRRVEVVVHRGAEGGGLRLRPVDAGASGSARTPSSAVYRRRSALRASSRLRVAEVEGAAVVRAQHEEAQRLAVVALQHVADGEEVAQRLGHLLVVDVEEAVVQPVR